MALRVGQKVKITDKPHLGVATVKFFGPTKFATGNWVGLALKTPGTLSLWSVISPVQTEKIMASLRVLNTLSASQIMAYLLGKLLLHQ